MQGTLPDSFAQWPELDFVSMSPAGISGTLPAAWGTPGTFPKLLVLYFYNNSLTGKSQAA